ncbi:MAG TPA: penicillin-binding protein 1C [Gammaproteobacteria bacterium]
MTRRRRRLLLATAALLALPWLWMVAAPKPALLDSGFSQALYDRHGRLLRLTLAADERYRLWVPLKQIAPVLIETTLLQEDRHFREHLGVNPVALLKAAWRTYGRGDRRVGASTITMQLARLRFGIDSRTIPGKLRQILRALQLEWHYSKDEILEAYLNLAPYGGNVEGIEAASRIYFDKPASAITLHEALTLTVIPQSPAARLPQPDSRDTPLTVARSALLDLWLAEHPQDKTRSERLRLPPQLRQRRDLPFAAPHFVNEILARQGTTEQNLHTTLDLPLQQLLERTLHDYVASVANLGIVNASALLLDTRDMGVRALIGSANYHDDAIQGQVDGTRALRSPGSTLKPFIYALGLQQGQILPTTLLKDAPFSLGSYNPENFDRDFAGPVSVQDALIRSRNIPAIEVARALREPDLYTFLQRAGVELPQAADYYGLALVLGGAEVRMQDLARLYALFAHEGELRPLRFTSSDEQPRHGTPLLTPAASYLTLEMLGHNPPPRRGFRAEWSRDALPVYWKTGTSYSYRDAWSVGLFGPYVLVVWVGNFDGQGNPAFLGRETAAPLFFRIVDAVRSHEQLTPHPLTPPPGVTRTQLCAVSGELPGRHCNHLVEGWFIAGVSPITPCGVHRAVAIDRASGLRSCSDVPGKVRNEVYEFWPSDILAIFRRAGVPRRSPPPYLPSCGIEQRDRDHKAPQITSPRTHLTYQYRPGVRNRSQLPLTAISDSDARTLYWFLNERFVGSSQPQESLLLTLKPGDYVVRVLDDTGNGDSRELHVELAP